MINIIKNSKNDVYKSFLLKDANYDGVEELTILKSCNEIPNNVINFTEALQTKDYNSWVCFYEVDYKFMRIWNNPKKYISILKKFNGVITPDFSLYVNMPLVMQKYHIFMGRALGHWFCMNGIKIIPNVRLGDKRTYDFALNGLNKGDVIAFGTLGCYKRTVEREIVLHGIREAINQLEPSAVLIYGSKPDEIINSFPNVKFYVYEGKNSRRMKERKNG